MRKEAPLILIVDDDADHRTFCRAVLEQDGFRCEIANDGAEALEHVSTHRPDLILMDGTMPRIDGWEAARRLKLNPATREIPIVMLTAHTFQHDRNRAAAAGVDDYLAKPMTSEELVTVIRRLLLLG